MGQAVVEALRVWRPRQVSAPLRQVVALLLAADAALQGVGTLVALLLAADAALQGVGTLVALVSE